MWKFWRHQDCTVYIKKKIRVFRLIVDLVVFVVRMAHFAVGSSSGENQQQFQIINETDSIIRGSGLYGDKRSAGDAGLDSEDDSISNELMGLDQSSGNSRGKTGKKTRGRVKIEMKYIENKLRRYTTFSKRKTGIMKKVSWKHIYS